MTAASTPKTRRDAAEFIHNLQDVGVDRASAEGYLKAAVVIASETDDQADRAYRAWGQCVSLGQAARRDGPSCSLWQIVCGRLLLVPWH